MQTHQNVREITDIAAGQVSSIIRAKRDQLRLENWGCKIEYTEVAENEVAGVTGLRLQKLGLLV